MEFGPGAFFVLSRLRVAVVRRSRRQGRFPPSQLENRKNACDHRAQSRYTNPSAIHQVQPFEDAARCKEKDEEQRTNRRPAGRDQCGTAAALQWRELRSEEHTSE